MATRLYAYDYPRPMVTVDAVVFTLAAEALDVLLIERKFPPFEGAWALPGGFVGMDEPLEDAAARELEEETGVRGVRLEQFYAFGEPGRDPRGRTISVAHWGVADGTYCRPRAGDDAATARWFPLASLPPLAFDHGLTIEYALLRLRAALTDRKNRLALLPGTFSPEDCERFCSAVSGQSGRGDQI